MQLNQTTNSNPIQKLHQQLPLNQQSLKLSTPNEIIRDKKQSQQFSHTIYLQRLLEKHTSVADLAQLFTANTQKQFENEIMNGRYHIKKRQWSAEEERLKTSASNKPKNVAEVLSTKKQLEEELEMIDEELNGTSDNKEITQQQRAAFLKRMDKEKKQLLRKKQEAIKLIQQHKIEQERRHKQQQQAQENEKKLKKKQQIQQRMRLQQQSKRKKEEDLKNQALVLKQKMKERTTAIKMEEQYMQKQNQSLEERKKRLAEIRMLHKPIDKKQLDAHAEKIEQLHQQRQAAATAEKPAEKSMVAFYKSIFYKKIKEEQKSFNDKKDEDEVSKLRQAKDKLKKYSEEIRQNFKPTIDEKKVEEIKFRSVNLRSRSMSSVQKSKQNESTNKIGLRYLEYSKLQVDHQKLLVSKEPEEQKDRKFDYLQDLRQKNKNRATQSAHDLLNKLEKVKIPKEEKIKKILQFADKLEMKAKRKEELERIGSNIVDGELDALYLQAIEAKLGLLEDY